jgi:putative heme-binding domain-containing protein
LRAIALRSLRPDHPALESERLNRLLDASDAGLRMEAVRTLAARLDAKSQDLLRRVATDSKADVALRAEAVLGLGHSAADSDETARLLVGLLDGNSAELRREAVRSLGGATGRPEVREAIQALQNKANRPEEIELAKLVLRAPNSPVASTDSRERAAKFELPSTGEKVGDAAAGGRLFFHPRGPQCFACHRVNGRGGNVGPDLSAIGRTLDREKLVRSLVTPSKDIAPQYTTWLVATRDGRLHTGIILREDPRGTIALGDAQGKTIEIAVADIEQRQAQTQSIMPENLTDQLTRSEFGDLVEFLSCLK